MKKEKSKNSKNIFYLVLAIVFILGVAFIIFNNYSSITGNFVKNSNVYTCYNCSDCSAAVDASTWGDIIQLDNDIVDAVGTCINLDNSVFGYISFDCQGHTIDGDGSGFDYGIYANTLSNSVISNCVVTNFNYGIFLTYPVYDNLTNNNFSYNTYNFYGGHNTDTESPYGVNIDSSNVVEAGKIYYNYSISDAIIDLSDAGLVYCESCNNVTYRNADIGPGNWVSLDFRDVNNSNIENIKIDGGFMGISFYLATNNTINNISISNTSDVGFRADTFNSIINNVTISGATGYGLDFGNVGELGPVTGTNFSNILIQDTSSTYHISQEIENSWNEIYKESFKANYETKNFNVVPSSGIVKLRITQKGIEFADIDEIRLESCGEFIYPEYVRDISSNEDLLSDILFVDNNVTIAHDKNIEILWNVPSNCYDDSVVFLTANEYGVANPFRSPKKDYFSYSFNKGILENIFSTLSDFFNLDKNQQIVIDGKIDEIDSKTKENYLLDWNPVTGHPKSPTYIYLLEDKDNLYFLWDITLDNTNELGEDFAEIIFNDNGEEKSFLINDTYDKWGKCGFGMTSKVNYNHQTCEFKIPKTEISFEKVNFAFRYYGTGGGGGTAVYFKAHDCIFENVTLINNMAHGFYSTDFHNNTVINLSSVDNGGSGSYLYGNGNVIRNSIFNFNSIGNEFHSFNNNVLKNISLNGNSVGIVVDNSDNNTINNSIIFNSTTAGLRFSSTSINNVIYNNIFNNSVNYQNTSAGNANFFNTTLISGTSIIEGSYIGGNYWGYPNGTGFSDSCTDANENSICDSNYTLSDGINFDYLPLANFEAPACTPDWFEGSFGTCNGTYQNKTWTDANECDALNITYLEFQECCIAVWSYSDWTTCVSSSQTRTATNTTVCNDTSNLLPLVQSCSTDDGGSSGGGGGGSGGTTTNTTTPGTTVITNETTGVTTVITNETEVVVEELANNSLNTTFESMSTNETTTISINDSDFGLTGISINVSEIVENASISIVEIENISEANIKLGIGKNFDSFELFRVDKVGITNDQIESVIIEFRVTIEWLIERLDGKPLSIAEDRLDMFKSEDGSDVWKKVPTTFLYSDDEYYYYRAETDGFSLFLTGLVEGDDVLDIEEESPEVIDSSIYMMAGILILSLIILIVLIIIYKKNYTKKKVEDKKIVKKVKGEKSRKKVKK